MLGLDSRILSNEKRTIIKGGISFLEVEQFEKLFFKYYGIFERNVLIGWECPYSGLIMKSNTDFALEHIIPVTKGGGTVLFNCVLSSPEANDSKDSKNLISWWMGKREYFTPERLEKLLNYLLDAYDLTFKDNVYEEIKFSMSDYINNKDENTGYYQLLLDSINLLNCLGVDTNHYEARLKRLKDNNVFDEIIRFTNLQNNIRDIYFESVEQKDCGLNISYMFHKINIQKLIDSIPNHLDKKNIEKVLKCRLKYISHALKYSQASFTYFLEAGKYYDILYKETYNIQSFSLVELINRVNNDIEKDFNLMIYYLENKESIPYSTRNFIKNITRIIKEDSSFTFHTRLSKDELIRLSLSKEAQTIYNEILYKSIKYDIAIDYVDTYKKEVISEYMRNLNWTTGLSDRLDLQQVYGNFISFEDDFENLIFYAESGKDLPYESDCLSINEERICNYIKNIIKIKQKKNRMKFNTSLNEEQLSILRNSEQSCLKELYNLIMRTAYVFGINDYKNINEKCKKLKL